MAESEPGESKPTRLGQQAYTQRMTTGPIRVGGVPEHFNLPWRLALESAELKDLSAEWADQPGGTGQMLSKLASRELDIVSILTEGTIAAIDQGAELCILQVYVESPLQWGVFVPAASQFVDESELRGARIAISRFNSGSHLMAYIHAEAQGWDVSDEQFVVVGGLDGAVDSFDANHSDLFLWEQHMTQPLVKEGKFRQLGVQETPWPSFVIAVRSEVLASRTTEVGRIVDLVVEQADKLHSMADIDQVIAQRYAISPETAQTWLSTTTFAKRSSMDPQIATTVLEALSRAGVGRDR